MTTPSLVRLAYAGLLLSCLAASSAQAQWRAGVPDDDSVITNFAAAEGQVVVIPPGANNACLEGAIVFSTDLERPTTTDGGQTTKIIKIVNLKNGAISSGKVTAPTTEADQFKYLSNDHNLVGFPNGLILYQIQTGLKSDLVPKPWWFDHTFREKESHFGPGARSAIVNFVSIDCGVEFKPKKPIDAYFEKDDPCGNPQPGATVKVTTNDPATGKITETEVPVVNPPFDMGGTDGPWSGYDHTTKSLYTVQGCWGSVRGEDSVGPGGVKTPNLANKSVNLSYVFASTDGDNWDKVAELDVVLWRKRVVGLSDKRLLVSRQGGVAILKPKASSLMTATSKLVSAPKYGWEKKFDPETSPVINSHIIASTQLVRSPSKKDTALFFMPANIKATTAAASCDAAAVMPATKACNNVNGFAVFRFDPGKSEPFVQIDMIVPLADAVPPPATTSAPPPPPANATGAIIHLTVADAGEGPIMAHWYDFDMITGRTVVRARVYLPNDGIIDLVLSRAAGADRSFFLNNKSFLGDYKGAAAFHSKSGSGAAPGSFVSLLPTTTFVPMWVEQHADGKREVHFTTVFVRQDKVLAQKNQFPPGAVSPGFVKTKLTHFLPRKPPFGAQPIRAITGRGGAEMIVGSRAEVPGNVLSDKYLRILGRAP